MECHTVNGNQRGFTFVELMVVLAIIALLLSVALPRYFAGLERAKEGVLKEDLFVMREAIDKYHLDKGQYPVSLQALVTDRYIREIPMDPFTEERDSWITIGLPQNRQLVFDVKSGAPGQANDGSLYYDW